MRRAASLVDNSVVLGGPWLCVAGFHAEGQAAALEGHPGCVTACLSPSEALSGRVLMLPAPALCVLLAHPRQGVATSVCPVGDCRE